MKKATPDIRARFGSAVRDRREALRLTQEELAERAGIHRTYLSDVERGTRNLGLLNIEKVASGLSLKISELFRDVGSARRSAVLIGQVSGEWWLARAAQGRDRFHACVALPSLL